MVKKIVIILGSLILATIFGVYGQGMSYYLNEKLVEIAPIYYLTFLTILSVFLYFISFVLTYLQYKKHRNNKNKLSLYSCYVIGCIGSLTPCWSVFVLAMWWG